MQIENSVFLVTGAGSGLGAATARMVVSAGGRVLIADVNRQGGEELAAELGANACFAHTDVTDEASAQAATLSRAVQETLRLNEALASDRLRALAHAFTAMAWQADFSFLYHRKRHLFHIGYRVADQHLDAGFYDLLASESRLTSVLAIAKGDVPVSRRPKKWWDATARTGLNHSSGSCRST